MDVLGAAAAAAILLEPELGLKLAGHHKSGLSGFSHVGFGDSVAETEVQGLYSFAIGNGSGALAMGTILINVINIHPTHS